VLPGLLLVPLLVRLPWLVVSNGLLSPLFGIVILSVATSGGRVVRLLQTPILVRLGHASFSMYLLHYPVLFWMTYLLKTGTVTAKLEGPWPILADSPAYLAAYLSLVIALALASYSLIESPARRQIRAWLSRPRDTKQVKSEVDAQAIAG
jgi:peptidoglycan/LPS O-acetylase OafA/YrhL